MNVAICGLGKMGMNLVLNLMDHGHKVVAYDINDKLVEEAEARGATGARTLEEVVNNLPDKKVIWMMVPAGDITEQLVTAIEPHLSPGDVLMDGGNAFYKDSMRRHEKLKALGIHYIDVGTSGGMEGAREGACTMVGGDKEAVSEVEQIFKDVSVTNGYLYTGRSGSGHFLKMVHNGVEYGMMQAIGEGFDILEKSAFDYDHEKVARVWNNGSVIRSWLMELIETAFSEDPKLDDIKGIVHASGEGRWTVETAMELETSAPVIALSLMMRNRSLENDTFSGKVVASLRNQFGGHSVELKDSK
ncbi:phosphogluconate dehydrogenase (NAD(+)-dependent, decarboxylating) [Alkalibacterium kapii]|uniref:6-phosphogluconate dehydrogenase (Decarboxylating) n=1 Tax=Alkalibacterium kapii TaxID=426704 RepID=A0A511ATM3_9LACT|nr:decarboxylating 6-phosphogluconate dehydrogenase [Alkalibacterium kapii]GEK91072.1 6-phosphogluconate dehydrogenase (decarboxylating) [Alkalibacterium kapii]